MCFNKEMSGGFAALGLVMSLFVQHKTGNTQMAIGIFYFFLMEFLQYFQYLVIDDCESETNQILTVLGFAHICFQPYFTHILNSSLTKSHTVLTMYVPVLRMCLIGGFLLFLRWVLSDVDGWRSALPIGEANDQGHNFGVSTEWLRGEKLCTFSGKYHLSWAVPMTDVSYYVPSAQIHSFLMFMPFFVIRTGFIIQGLFLLLTGPVLAAYISPSMFEQASIWCFFSIAQIAIMLFLIRATLLKGDDTADKKVSKKKTPEQPYIKYILGVWPLEVLPSRSPKKTK